MASPSASSMLNAPQRIGSDGRCGRKPHGCSLSSQSGGLNSARIHETNIVQPMTTQTSPYQRGSQPTSSIAKPMTSTIPGISTSDALVIVPITAADPSCFACRTGIERSGRHEQHDGEQHRRYEHAQRVPPARGRRRQHDLGVAVVLLRPQPRQQHDPGDRDDRRHDARASPRRTRRGSPPCRRRASGACRGSAAGR
jgi:hypothetical protein